MYRLLIVISILCFGHAYGQNLKKISVSVYNETIAFPFTRFTPIHPGAELGITLKEVQKKNSIRNINLNAGFYHHKRLENGIYLRGEYLYRPMIKSFMTVDFAGNLGYMRTFYPGEIYDLTEEGNFEPVSQSGRSHLITSLGVGFTLIKNEKFEPFIRQENGSTNSLCQWCSCYYSLLPKTWCKH